MSDCKYRNSVNLGDSYQCSIKKQYYSLSFEPGNLCKLLLNLTAEIICTGLDI